MSYREHRVDGGLGQWVECAWTREGPDGHDRVDPEAAFARAEIASPTG